MIDIDMYLKLFPAVLMLINLFVVATLIIPKYMIWKRVYEPGVIGDRANRRYQFSRDTRYAILLINSIIILIAIGNGLIILV